MDHCCDWANFTGSCYIHRYCKLINLYIYTFVNLIHEFEPGHILDNTLFISVNYTDVDYNVYSDAGRLLLEGKSPYERSTYRYPPVFAALMTANHLIHSQIGKLSKLIEL